ncbi:MAG: translocation/assembly module TamB [Polyangiaceae bacterium]|nr:translocation/assembly module TamB [Polyangiaceae bacterium]
MNAAFAPKKSQLAVTALSAGLAVWFLATALLGVLVHLNVPAARRIVARETSAALGSLLSGAVTVEHVGRLDLRGLSGVRARVRDPEGVEVLFVDGLRVDVCSLCVVRSLFGKGEIVFEGSLAVDHADVLLDTSSLSPNEASFRLVTALSPRSPAKETRVPGPSVRVDVPRIELRHAWVRGRPAGLLSVDADLRELTGSFHYDDAQISANVDRLDVQSRALPRGVNPSGIIAGHLRMPLHDVTHVAAGVSFDGTLFGAPATLHANVDEMHTDAVLDVRDASGESVQTALPELNLGEPASLHAELHGQWPRASILTHVVSGKTTIDANVGMDMSDMGVATRFQGDVQARSVNAHALAKSLPDSELGFDIQANVVVPKNGRASGSFTAQSLAGTFARVIAPRMDLRANFDGNEIRAELEASVPDLARLGNVANLRGSAELHARGKMHIATTSIEGDAEVSGKGVTYGESAVDQVHALITARGTLAQPAVEVCVHTEGARSPNVRTGSMDARGTIEKRAASILVHDPHVDLARKGVSASILADRIEISADRLAIEHAIATGVGSPIYVDMARSPRDVTAKVVAKEIDLGRAAVLVGHENDVRAGTLTMDSNMLFRRAESRGELHAKLRGLSAFRVRGAHMDLDAAVADRTITLDIDGEIDSVGRMAFHATRMSVSGDPAKLSSWRGLSGRIRFESAIYIPKAIALLPPETLPIGHASGWIFARGTLARDSATAPPDGRMSVYTKGLSLSGAAPPETTIGETAVKRTVGPSVSDIDVALNVRADGLSGDGQLAVRLIDPRGMLAALDFKAIVPYSDLLRDPSAALDKLEKVSVSGALVIPERDVDQLPSVFGAKAIAGAVGADLRVWGTLLEPHIQLAAHARGARSKHAPASTATDTEISFAYDGTRANVDVDVQGHGHHLARATSSVDIQARDLLAEGFALTKASGAVVARRASAELAWNANAKITFDGFPLELVGELADRRVHGNVTGNILLTGLHDDARLQARLALDSLRIGRADYPTARIALDASGDTVTLALRVEQTDGFADIRARSGLTWGRELAPRMNEAHPLEARLVARAFRAAAVLPFVSDLLNDLDGRIDGDAAIAIDPATKSSTMNGRVVLHDASMQVASIGEVFENARATATFSPDGAIHVDGVEADSGDGHVIADAVIHLRGLSLQDATMNVKIPQKRPIDFAFQGQSIGGIWGNAKVLVRPTDGEQKTSVAVDVPNFHVKLSQSLKTGVEEFQKNEKIKVGMFLSPNEFLRLRLDNKDLQEQRKQEAAIDVDVTLGEVVVDRGTEVHVVLTGRPRVALSDKTRMSGEVHVKSGKIDLQGKVFVVERGTITFQPEDASNPTVVASAVWTANDGTKVFADFDGPLKSGRLNVRSEPARPRNEVLALVLFGSADGPAAGPPPASGRSQNSSAAAAATVGGAIATQGLSAALDDLTGIHATARIETTAENNPRPELDLQLSRALTLRFAHVLGTPPITDPDTNLAIIDWRFHTNWSLETTFGDHGKAVADAVWQRRY